MTKQVEISQEAQARRDHRAWLEDYGRWRSEHREALAMLTRVQAAILEREAALERQAAEVQSHELELQDYELVGGGAGTPDPEKAIPAHAEFALKHDRERADAGVHNRGRFIIDPDGVVQAIEILTSSVGRNPDELVRQLAALQHVRATGEATPAGWVPGQPTLKPSPDLVGKVWTIWKPTVKKNE